MVSDRQALNLPLQQGRVAGEIRCLCSSVEAAAIGHLILPVSAAGRTHPRSPRLRFGLKADSAHGEGGAPVTLAAASRRH